MAIFFGNDIEVSGALTLLVGTGYLDMNRQELRNAIVQNAAEPTGMVAADKGRIVFNSTTNKFGYYNGTAWFYPDMSKSVYDADDDGIVDNSEQLGGQAGSFYLSRANHTGTQASSTISDFTEAAQDAVGAALVDSTSIDLSYTDASNQITAILKLETNSGLEILANGLQLTNTVTAGTYTKVTVDAKGRVTAGTTLTTGDLPSHFHTWSQISDFTTGVRLNKLNEMAAPSAAVSMNSQKITDVATPTAANDAANKSYVDGLVQGIDAKQSVVAATTANIANLATGAPSTLDGVTLAVNDRVLVKDQTTQSSNGIYVVSVVGSGSNGQWARAADMDVWTEVPAAFTFVEKGTTNGDTGWLCTADAGGTLGTTAITWVKFSSAGEVTGGVAIEKSGSALNLRYDTNSLNIMSSPSNTVEVKRKSNGGIGVDANGVFADVDNSTIVLNGGKIALATAYQTRKTAATITGNASLTAFSVTHNFNTTDVLVEVFDSASTQTVYAQVTRAANAVTVTFKVAPASGKTYRVVVVG